MATAPCTHLDEIRDVTPSANGCEDCLNIPPLAIHAVPNGEKAIEALVF